MNHRRVPPSSCPISMSSLRARLRSALRRSSFRFNGMSIFVPSQRVKIIFTAFVIALLLLFLTIQPRVLGPKKNPTSLPLPLSPSSTSLRKHTSNPNDDVSAAAAPFLLTVSRVNITPTEPVFLSGFASRISPPSQASLLDASLPLYARAVAIRPNHNSSSSSFAPLVLVSLDVVAIPRGWSTRLRTALCRAHSLPLSHLHFIATHTHSGPAIAGTLTPLNPSDATSSAAIERYTSEQLSNSVTQVVNDVLFSLSASGDNSFEPTKTKTIKTPVYGHFSRGAAQLAVNRREIPERSFRPGGPVGQVDHTVAVLHFTTSPQPAKHVRAVLFSYAAHATVLTTGQRYSPDLPGVAAKAVEQAHPEALALFLPGCGGDQNVYPRGSLQLLARHGATLANTVLHALSQGVRADVSETIVSGGNGDSTSSRADTDSNMSINESNSDSLNVATAIRNVTLYFAASYNRTELRRRARLSVNGGGSETANRIATRAAKHLLHQEAMSAADAKTPGFYETTVGAWRIGSVVMAMLPGEPTVGYAARVRALGADFVLGYVDDVMGYIGTADVVRSGGREGGERAAWYYGLPAAWTPDVESIVVSAVHEAITAISVISTSK